LPVFGKCQIARIKRYEIESFFARQATKYSRSTIRSMRISFGLLLSYAVENGWLKENPVKGVKLPRAENCAGRRVYLRVLSPSQTISIAKKLSEPYTTLVLFLAVTGLRIGEAIAIKWSDFEGDVLHVQRRMYNGKVDTTKSRDSKRRIPIPPALLERLKALGDIRRMDLACTRWCSFESVQCLEALHSPGREGAQHRLGRLGRLPAHVYLKNSKKGNMGTLPADGLFPANVVLVPTSC
jgi:integrase